MYSSSLLTVWEYMEEGFKFYVDEGRKHIVFAPDTETISVKVDLYKALKSWYKVLDNSRYSFPIRTIGGDRLPGNLFAGDLYFLINGYRVVYDPRKVKIDGVLYSDDFETAFLYSEDLSPVYPATVSNLVQTAGITGGGTGITQEDINNIAEQVWAQVTRTLTTPVGVTDQDKQDIAQEVWDHIV